MRCRDCKYCQLINKVYFCHNEQSDYYEYLVNSWHCEKGKAKHYNMMSRDKFKKTINMLIEKDKEIGWFYDKFKSNFLIDITGEYFDTIANLLSHTMNDKCEYVSWWLFECDYGKDTPYVWEDDKKIILDSIDKLYDFLVGNSKH